MDLREPLRRRLPLAPASSGPLPVDQEADHSEQNIDTVFVPETRRPLHSFIPTLTPSSDSPGSIELNPCPAEPVYPGVDYESFFNLLPESRVPEEREVVINGALSNQFPYIDLPYEFGVFPPQTIHRDHHSGRDPTLLVGSVAKRLRFREPHIPVPLTAQDITAGDLLFAAHCRAYGRNPDELLTFDPVRFAEAVSINEYNSLTTKTKGVIAANALRSDPDWRHTVVRIFAKTQQKVNEGTVFGDWKACQTLALMHDAVLLIFGPVIKYLEATDSDDCPDNIFIYGGKTPSELSEAAKKLSPGLKSTNDYTSFDQNQGREAQRLEEHRLRRVGIPEELISWYIFIKTNLECQFGPLTSMRFTGEPGTYRFNSDFNLAVIYLQHDVPRSVMVFISGDDSLIGAVLPVLSSWNYIRARYFQKLQFKLEVTPHGLFCGYYLSHVGAVRSPLILLHKLMLATADSTISQKHASYLSEFVVGHSLGQAMWEGIPDELVFHQSAVFDYFCRHTPTALKSILRVGAIPQNQTDALLLSGFSVPSMFSGLSQRARRFLHTQHRGLRIGFSNRVL